MEADAKPCHVLLCNKPKFWPFKFCKEHVDLHDQLIAKAKKGDTLRQSLFALEAMRKRLQGTPEEVFYLFSTYESAPEKLSSSSLYFLLSEDSAVRVKDDSPFLRYH